MKVMQHHSSWWEPRWFVLLSVYSAPHLMALFAAEPQTDDSDSEDGYLDYEGMGGLDELDSDIEIQPDDASSDEGYMLPVFPFLASFH